MYSLAQLKRGLNNPLLFGRELNRLYHRRFYSHRSNPEGVDVFEESWDNLLLLDACRYDTFAEHADIPGALESRVSRGSATTEFLRANFDGRDLTDTVYVTANPQLYGNRDTIRTELHAVVDVWKEDGWDERLGTVRPETLTRYAKEAAERYPNKRLFVHYMQPHYPFIGSDTEADKGHLKAFVRGDGGGERRAKNPEEMNVWDQMIHGKTDLTKADVWDAYTENLRLAVPHITELIEALEGRTVVTSDHGNMIGERAFPVPIAEWGHPRGIYTEELVTVPWLIVDAERRKEVVAESGAEAASEVADDVVKERLSDLGYA